LAVHNDFHQTHALFPLFDALSVANIDARFEVDSLTLEVPQTSNTKGTTNGIKNGTIGTDGIKDIAADKKKILLPNGINNITLTTGLLEPQ